MLSVYILLDRSGSMQSRWKSSIDSINEYVNVLKHNNVEGKINFITFDLAHNPYIRSMSWGAAPTAVGMYDQPVPAPQTVTEVVRLGNPIAGWVPLTGNEVTPRGSTPLFDAVVEVKQLMLKDNSSKGILLIMTDGQENASKNRKDAAEGVVSYVKAREWEVVFLGANFDVAGDASSMGLAAQSYATFSDRNAVRAMNLTATKSALYARGVEGAMAYSAVEKTAMVSED